MKNIIWKLPNDNIVYFSYASEVNTQTLSVALKNANAVDSSWEAVAFDREIPNVRQDLWRFENDNFTFVSPPREEIVEKVLNSARVLRTEFFNLADGLQASFLALGQTQYATDLEVYKEGLRNITITDLSSANTEEEMKDIISDEYEALKNALPLAIKIKFYQTLQ